MYERIRVGAKVHVLSHPTHKYVDGDRPDGQRCLQVDLGPGGPPLHRCRAGAVLRHLGEDRAIRWEVQCSSIALAIVRCVPACGGVRINLIGPCNEGGKKTVR